MKVCIIGGTGTLGQELIRQLHSAEITVFSRDELKQQRLKAEFPRIRTVLGCIREYESVNELFARGPFEAVFHVAALKQVDTLESNVKEAVKTNVLGTMNVADAAVRHYIPRVLFSSTDKAVLPINSYGMSKAIAERYLYDLNQRQNLTRFAVYRWGNVVGSRGSAIPYFINAIKAGGPVNITHYDMTRFWIGIDTACQFMLDTYLDAPIDRPKIPPMKASSVIQVVDVLAGLLGKEKPLIKITGIRPGEKIHECIWTSHDSCIRSDTAEQFTAKELTQLLHPIAERLA